VTTATLPAVCGVQAWQYRDYAALRGDPSDNLPGVRGFGSATAARLLTTFGTLDAVFAALDGSEGGGDGGAVRTVIGDALTEQLGLPESRETIERNRRLMRMYAELSIPELETTRLPLNLLAMRRVLAERGIILGPSLWALTGGAPPLTEEDLLLVPQPWVWRRSSRSRRDPAPGQLALF
jgi:5'-3' exonuclease